MEKINARLSKVVCCAILLLLPAFINVGQAVGAPTQNVNVVNTPDVNVVNTPSVSVTNTPSVNVVNPPSTPLPVLEVGPGSQPFQVEVGDLWTAGQSNKDLVLVTVPQGKRLIIEYATAGGFLDSGSKMTAIITTTVGTATARHSLVMAEQGVVAGSLVFSAAQSMRLYADPGTNVLGSFAREPTTFGGGAGMTISGYYVDLP